MAALRLVRRFSAAAEAAAPAAPAAPAAGSRWERMKRSKAVGWCRGLVSDYWEACRDIVVGSRERPLKASVYAALLAGTWACCSTRPDRASFEAALLERCNRLGLLSAWTRSGDADGHVRSLVKLGNEGRLRHASAGLFSLVYRSDHAPDTALYEARCSDLAAPWRELPGRLLDVGFAGRWWVLDSKMKNYDVNQEEFKHLPPHMQLAAPPAAQEVERSERLHRESWLALRGGGEDSAPPLVDAQEEGQRRAATEKTED